MRVIAGVARGRPLRAPKGRTARPTSDRVREALFSSLGDEVVDAVVLDLFAGTGALGIEALSRGAASAVFVERNAGVATVLGVNLDSTGVDEQSRVVRAEAETFVARPTGGPFTVVFCDPPYEDPLDGVVRLVEALSTNGALATGARVVIERDRRDPALQTDPLDLGSLLAMDRQRSYGDTVLLFLRVKEG
jgi:16S rRNA (guanine966-N2)-methyltransferase